MPWSIFPWHHGLISFVLLSITIQLLGFAAMMPLACLAILPYVAVAAFICVFAAFFCVLVTSARLEVASISLASCAGPSAPTPRARPAAVAPSAPAPRARAANYYWCLLLLRLLKEEGPERATHIYLQCAKRIYVYTAAAQTAEHV